MLRACKTPAGDTGHPAEPLSAQAEDRGRRLVEGGELRLGMLVVTHLLKLLLCMVPRLWLLPVLRLCESNALRLAVRLPPELTLLAPRGVLGLLSISLD